MTYILTGILLYLLYRFITGFVWPVYKATSEVKKQFDSMKTQMDSQPFNEEKMDSDVRINEKPKFDPGGEYIPFEEIKPK